MTVNDAIQVLEDTLGKGRYLRITIEFFLNNEGEPEVDYEVTEDGEHVASDVALNGVSDALVDMARAIAPFWGTKIR